MTTHRLIHAGRVLARVAVAAMVLGILVCLPSAFAQGVSRFAVRGSERHYADTDFTPAEVLPAVIAQALKNFEDQLKPLLKTGLPGGPTPAGMRDVLAAALQGKLKPPERMKLTYSAVYYPDPDPLSNGKWSGPGAQFLIAPTGRTVPLEVAPASKGFLPTVLPTAEISYQAMGLQFAGDRGQNPTGAFVVVHADVLTVLTLKVELDPAYLVSGNKKNLTAAGSGATDAGINDGTIKKVDRQKAFP